MKKFAILAFSLSALVNSVAAQFYVRAGLGYAFPQAGQTMDVGSPIYGMVPYNGSRTNTLNATSSNINTSNYNIKNASFSAGMQAVLGLGYWFTDHVGVQLDGDMGISTTKYTFVDNLVPLNFTSGYIPGNIKIAQQSAKPLILMPSLVLQSGGDKWNIYSRFGLALPLSADVTQQYAISNAPGTGALTTEALSFTVKSSFTLGFCAAAGVQYKLDDRISIWGELSMLSLAVNAKESDLKSFTIDGFSYPVSSAGAPAVVKYSKSAITDSTGTTAPSYTMPFSNVGFNVGISLRLSDKKSSRHSGLIDDNKNFKRKKF